MAEFSTGENWKISIFQPFDRNGIRTFSFRLYGEISGSMYKEYNDNLQWCGGVDYLLDLKSNKLDRSEYDHKLHDVITKQINVPALLEKI